MTARRSVEETIQTLNDALAAVGVLAGDEQRRIFFARLFAAGATPRLLELSGALKNCSAVDPETTDTVCDYWVGGSSYEVVVERLGQLAPDVSWDARHIFSSISLETLESAHRPVAGPEEGASELVYRRVGRGS